MSNSIPESRLEGLVLDSIFSTDYSIKLRSHLHTDGMIKWDNLRSLVSRQFTKMWTGYICGGSVLQGWVVLGWYHWGLNVWDTEFQLISMSIRCYLISTFHISWSLKCHFSQVSVGQTCSILICFVQDNQAKAISAPLHWLALFHCLSTSKLLNSLGYSWFFRFRCTLTSFKISCHFTHVFRKWKDTFFSIDWLAISGMGLKKAFVMENVLPLYKIFFLTHKWHQYIFL